MFTNKQFLDSFKEGDLAKVAEAANMDLATFKTQYMEAVQSPDFEKNVHLKIEEGKQEGECRVIHFEIGFYKVLAIKGHVKVCLGEKWEFTFSIGIYLFGNKVLEYNYSVNYLNPEICFNIDLILLKGGICFGGKYRNGVMTPYIKGNLTIYVPWPPFKHEVSFFEWIG